MITSTRAGAETGSCRRSAPGGRACGRGLRRVGTSRTSTLSHMRIRRSDDRGSTFRTRAHRVRLPRTSSAARRGSAGPATRQAPRTRDRPQQRPAPRARLRDLGRVGRLLRRALPRLAYRHSRSESEKNDFFVRATPFAIGDLLRGTFSHSAVRRPLSPSSGIQGQTIYTWSPALGPRSRPRRRCGSCASADTTSFVTLPLRSPSTRQRSRRSLSRCPRTAPTTCASTPPPAWRRTASRPALDTPTPGERARDHRDRFISHSDDGTTAEHARASQTIHRTSTASSPRSRSTGTATSTPSGTTSATTRRAAPDSYEY